MEGAMEWIGLRVERATIKEEKDGGTTVEATVTGSAVGAGMLIPAVGQGVSLTTGGGKRQHAAYLRTLTIKVGKDDKLNLRLKVCGGPGLDELVGLGVQVAPRHMSLPADRKSAAGHDA